MVKKQKIMESALELFAENGIESTSIQQITERCGISKGAFYLAYKSKSELVIGIVDHFLSEFSADIERSVSKEQSSEKLLYNFYYTAFSTYQKHMDFAMILMKEHSKALNAKLLEKVYQYDKYMNTHLFSLVNRQFSDIDKAMYPDLVYLIKGFLRQYAELIIIFKYPLDLDLLCRALVERTTIIAEHATIHFISPDFLHFPNWEGLVPTKEQLQEILQRTEDEISDAIVLESIGLLKNELESPHLPSAVVQGLLKNLRDDSHSKWSAYLYDLYLKND